MSSLKADLLVNRLKAGVKTAWNTICRRENRRVVLIAAIAIAILAAANMGARRYAEWRQERAADTETAFAEETADEPDVPEETEYTIPQQYVDEAEAVARVLYGIRDNSVRDQRTYIWCIFNRVDNPSREFATTLEEAIGKPSQWMFYDPSNPILESLYQIALAEVIVWHEGHRPVSCDWVFAVWSSEKIYLTKELGGDEQWRYPENR